MALERMLMKRSDQVFAYTPGGAEFARESGVNLDRITTVMNTLDTSYASQALAPDTVLAFRERWGLRPGERVYGYIGGLDASKRVGFLAESLDRLWEIDRSARVLVAGEGRDADLLSSHVNRGQVVRLGFADNSTKAAIGAVSSAILMPGRIGLIACDALALGVPLVSTRWPFHAPEAEYLQEGDSVFYAADEPADFARVVHGGAFVRRKRTVPSLEQMTENFAHGVHRMLA
ncbi:glycosyltransferase [Microbacterium sp. AG1240]|uniref:glycosyltransferase n=1 Tax=Microbacterium sp. AG1240 TaxID=2183992 RepID=UPI001600A4C5|nr:glycosyltransferase [Microbacterium sp. AG1240]